MLGSRTELKMNLAGSDVVAWILMDSVMSGSMARAATSEPENAYWVWNRVG